MSANPLRASVANPGPLGEPERNWYRLPLDWFERIRFLRQTYGLRRCIGPIKVMEYLIKHTWGCQNFDGSVSMSLPEFETGKLDGDGHPLDLGTRLSRPTIVAALKLLVEADWVERIATAHNGNNNRPFAYRPRLLKSKKKRKGGIFAGFPYPEDNFFRVPWVWTDLMTTTNSEILIVITEYMMRHQWGFARKDGAERWPVGLTMEELAHGRLNRQKGRYDGGTGYDVRDIRKALRKRVLQGVADEEHLWLLWNGKKTSRSPAQWYLRLEDMEFDQETGEFLDAESGGKLNRVVGGQTKQGQGARQTGLGGQAKQGSGGKLNKAGGQDEQGRGKGEQGPSLPILKDNQKDNQSDNQKKRSSSQTPLYATLSGKKSDDDDLSIFRKGDFRKLMRAVGIKNIQGTHDKILRVDPPVRPEVVLGWYLANHADLEIKKPGRYTATVLQNEPQDRDQVPDPFLLLASLSPANWTVFAEWNWRGEYLRESLPDELVSGDAADAYSAWQSVYGGWRIDELPLELGEEAAARVAQFGEVVAEPEQSAVLGSSGKYLMVSHDELDGSQLVTDRMKASQVWQAALGEIQLQMSKASFETWVKPIQVVKFDRETKTLVVAALTEYIADWINSKVKSSLERSLRAITERAITKIQLVLLTDDPVRT